MNNFVNKLIFLRGLEKDEVISTICAYYDDNSDALKNDFVSAVYCANAQDDLLGYIQKAILYDENAYSMQCAKNAHPSERLIQAFSSDLKEINKLIDFVKGLGLFDLDESLPIFTGDELTIAKNLCAFYAQNGYGRFAKYRAFVYRENCLSPVKNTDGIRLEQLKDYQTEKKVIIDNVNDFLCGLPYSNMLLYGDRGTGKSSTVHAVLNEFYDRGLRLIEVSKYELRDISKIRESVAGLPLKFMIFIDDLSFEGGDRAISALKASVEGSIVNGDNAMIVATSNRRHIVSESFSERENSVHPSELAEEQLSLSDRFGLTVIFSSTDKNAYLSIVRQLAEDKGLTTPIQQLEALAERWAIVKGGRSPRRAEQFINLVYSCEKSCRNIEF